ncbi:MAG: Ig-like domain-containing protein, partial [Thermoanaerobaculia bacterium]
VLGNDTDPDSPTLTAVLVSGPAHAASFTLHSDGSFDYVHDGSETTSDTFTYKANDGSADSNVATVTITVTPVNDPPTAADDNYTVAEGGTLNVTAPGVLGNDTDSDSPSITAVLVSGPAHASSFTLNADGSFTYVHDGSETTLDTFTYKANDGSADSNVATVTIHITPVDDAPVASNDTYSTNSGATLNVAAPGVLANDTDPDGPSLTAVLVSGPAHAASFALNGDGSFTYQSTTGFAGTDTFTYKVSDGTLFSNVATVTITVINQPPTANPDSFAAVGNTQLRVGTGATTTPSAQVAASVLDNDTDADTPHGSLTVSTFDATSASGGSVSMNPNGTFNYLPPVGFTGNDSFHYTVSDGTSTSSTTVTIVVSNRVWYVRNTAAAGDGRSTSPFSTLFNAQTAAAFGDIIYVHTGDGTTNGQNSGIVLASNQKLIGQGVALIVGPYTLNPAGGTPSIGNAGGTGVTLAAGDTVAGLNITASTQGISGVSVNSGTIDKVSVVAGTDAISLPSVTGTVTCTDVTASTSGAGAAALVASGSATLNASGTSSLTSSNGAAADLTGLNLGVTLVSANASNAATGLRLTSTTGSFTITGLGTTAGSGGTIQNMTGNGVEVTSSTNVTLNNMNILNTASTQTVSGSACGGNLVSSTNMQCVAAIYLRNATNASFDRILVDGTSQVGINGNAVNGFTLTNSEVRNAGNENSESGLLFQNLNGTVNLTSDSIHSNAARQVHIENLSGALALTASGGAFSTSTSTIGQQGALIALHNGATGSVSFANATFNANGAGNANALQVIGTDSSNLTVSVTGSSFTNNAAGVVLSVSQAATMTFDVSNNPVFTGDALQAMSISKATGSTGSLTGTILNNVIGTTGIPGSACSILSACNGIDIRNNGGGTLAATITGNDVRQVGGTAIRAIAASGNGSMQVKVNANTIAEPVVLTAGNAINVNSGAVSSDTTSVCADIFNNVISGTWD